MDSEKGASFNEKKIIKDADVLKKCIKVIVFFMIGILIFGVVQYIFIPKRFPYIKSYDAGKLKAYYAEENNSIDVLICSTSHASKGILPMELYEKYGIKSYNLSTSIQPIEATYYVLSEALKTQSPKVFVFDVSNLFMSSSEKNYWQYVLDEMHFGKNKLAFAREYKRSAGNCDETMEELLIPMLRYHTRWKELNKQDFIEIFMDKQYFGKGGQINSIIAGADVSVEQMNLIESELLKNTEKSKYLYDGEEIREEHEEGAFYSVDIPEKNIEWLKKIKALCDENDIQFLAIKVPTIYWPQSYRSAWTTEKCVIVRSLCEEQGISYYDMLYDTDLAIDWSHDTTDNGQHVNLYGAQKVSDKLGMYLREHYELSQEREVQWDEELSSYQEVREIALLQLEGELASYLHMLKEKHSDKTIFICVSGDMTTVLQAEEVSALRALGLQADFSDAFQKSYIAMIVSGKVKYEALSDRQLSYRGMCDKSEKSYDLFSSGWWTNPEASIKIANEELASKDREGINIVVYDDEKALTIDSVCFDISTEMFTAVRNNSKIAGFEVAVERYITEAKNR